MRNILIVEDHAFSAFCLSRILESSLDVCQVRMVSNSVEARAAVLSEDFDLIILDGDLGAGDGINCNGPALADLLWSENPWLSIVVWSDSEKMCGAFAHVFKRHQKAFNEHFCWPKMVGKARVQSFFARCFPSIPYRAIQDSGSMDKAS